jgi:hypothetical protein
MVIPGNDDQKLSSIITGFLYKFRRVSLSGYHEHQEPDLPWDFGRGQGED